ncbi:MAG: hypothetical protein ACOYM3_12490 [Terrimicrobiaceae bacterium]
MEQLVIIVIIGLISLVNWLMQRSAQIREERKQERERLGIPEGDPFHGEEAAEVAEHRTESSPAAGDPSANMRKLLEALGLPVEEAAQPPQAITPRPVAPEITPPPALPRLPAYRSFTPPKPRPENPNAQAFVMPPPAVTSPLVLALRSHEGVRQAIVLREILGPPKALSV